MPTNVVVKVSGDNTTVVRVKTADGSVVVEKAVSGAGGAMGDGTGGPVVVVLPLPTDGTVEVGPETPN